MTASLHLDELVKFLDTAGKKGWIKPSTAKVMRNTCERVFGALDAEEKVDVAEIDIDDALTRFANKNTDVASGSLGQYKSRLRSAVKMFTDAKANPTSWKPPSSRGHRGTGNRKGTSPKGATSNGKPPKRHKAPGTATPPAASENVAEVLGRGLSYPFPLRADVTITISNIPRDLRATEVDRIAQFLKALAIGDHKA